MSLLKFLDKKFTFEQQRSWLKSYILFGIPFGICFTEILNIFRLGWKEYHFNLLSIFIVILIDLLLFSQLEKLKKITE